jgi:hypothetical protein
MASPSSVIASAFDELDPAALSLPVTGAAKTPEGKPGTETKSDDVAAAKAGETKEDDATGTETKKFATDEAVSELEKLEGLGVTTANAESMVQKASALDTVVGWLENDQSAFLNHLRHNSPAAFQKLLDKATDLYLEINPTTGSSVDNGGALSGSGGNQTSDVMKEITAIRTRLDRRDEADTKTATQQRIATVEKGYTDKVTTLLTTAGLSTRDFKAVKALINEEVSGDQKTLVEINRGTFIGLAKITARVLAEWTADTTKAATEETTRREKVQSAGSKTVPGAPQNTGGESTRGRGQDAFDSAGDEFARALSKKK